MLHAPATLPQNRGDGEAEGAAGVEGVGQAGVGARLI